MLNSPPRLVVVTFLVGLVAPIEARESEGTQRTQSGATVEILRAAAEGRLSGDRLASILEGVKDTEGVARERAIWDVFEALAEEGDPTARSAVAPILIRMNSRRDVLGERWGARPDENGGAESDVVFFDRGRPVRIPEGLRAHQPSELLGYWTVDSCDGIGDAKLRAGCVVSGVHDFRSAAIRAFAEPLRKSKGEPSVLKQYLELERDVLLSTIFSSRYYSNDDFASRLRLLLAGWLGRDRPVAFDSRGRDGAATVMPLPAVFNTATPSRWSAWADILQALP